MDGGWKWPSSAMRGPDSRTKFHGKKIWPTQLVCGTCNIAIGTMNNLNPVYGIKWKIPSDMYCFNQWSNIYIYTF
jgi:ribosomal protein L34E